MLFHVVGAGRRRGPVEAVRKTRRVRDQTLELGRHGGQLGVRDPRARDRLRRARSLCQRARERQRRRGHDDGRALLRGRRAAVGYGEYDGGGRRASRDGDRRNERAPREPASPPPVVPVRGRVERRLQLREGAHGRPFREPAQGQQAAADALAHDRLGGLHRSGDVLVGALVEDPRADGLRLVVRELRQRLERAASAPSASIRSTRSSSISRRGSVSLRRARSSTRPCSIERIRRWRAMPYSQPTASPRSGLKRRAPSSAAANVSAARSAASSASPVRRMN